MYKNVILLCKGSSVLKVSKEEILSNDLICWANIHNTIDVDIIPNKVDVLYLRDRRFIEELEKKYIKNLESLSIKEVFTTFHSMIKIIGIKVSNDAIIKFRKYKIPSPSTGLIAINHIIEYYKPEVFTIAGLDLFEDNKPLYYYDISRNLSSKKNQKSLMKNFLNGNIVKDITKIHSDIDTINFLFEKISNKPDILFKFYTNSELLKDKLNDLPNVNIC